MSTGMLFSTMGMNGSNIYNGVLRWLNLSLKCLGLCVKRMMLHNQWFAYKFQGKIYYQFTVNLLSKFIHFHCFICRLLPAMAGIVINFNLPTTIVPGCGQKIGLAGLLLCLFFLLLLSSLVVF